MRPVLGPIAWNTAQLSTPQASPSSQPPLLKLSHFALHPANERGEHDRPVIRCAQYSNYGDNTSSSIQVSKANGLR